MTLSQSPPSTLPPPSRSLLGPRNARRRARELPALPREAASLLRFRQARVPAPAAGAPRAALGAPHGDAAAAWQVPSLTSAVTRKALEDLVVLLHAVTQLAQIARAHALAAAAGSPAHAFLRTVRASLSALSHLPLVRDVDRIEEALAAIPKAQASSLSPDKESVPAMLASSSSHACPLS